MDVAFAYVHRRCDGGLLLKIRSLLVGGSHHICSTPKGQVDMVQSVVVAIWVPPLQQYVYLYQMLQYNSSSKLDM